MPEVPLIVALRKLTPIKALSRMMMMMDLFAIQAFRQAGSCVHGRIMCGKGAAAEN